MDRFTCKTRDDVVKYFVSWLRTVDREGEVVYKNGWRLEMGFRLAFHIHQVWFHEDTGRYIFHVSEEKDWDGIEKNITVYSSFIKMLDGISDRQAYAWNILN